MHKQRAYKRTLGSLSVTVRLWQLVLSGKPNMKWRESFVVFGTFVRFCAAAAHGDQESLSFWKNAQNDVEQFMKFKENWENQRVVNELLKLLKENYPEREWYVTIYGFTPAPLYNFDGYAFLEGEKGTGVSMQGDYVSSFRCWNRSYLRYIAVASPDGNSTSEFKNKASECLETELKLGRLTDGCEEAVGQLKNCMGNVWYNVIGCVKETTETNYAYAKTGDGSIYKTMNASYSRVFASEAEANGFYHVFFTF